MSGEETENDTTKAIAVLTTSVKAIQEELKTIKSGATDSGVNSQSGMKRRATDGGIILYAGSQDSDLAYGQDLPAKISQLRGQERRKVIPRSSRMMENHKMK